MNVAAPQVFAGGWDQLIHAKLRDTSDMIMGFPVDVSWKLDGTKFMVLNASAADEILEFTALVPHSTIGATQTGQLSINPPESNPRGMYWHCNGTKFWFIGTGADTIFEYHLTIPWDLSTAFDPNISATPTGTGGSLRDLVFVNKGLTILMSERNNDELLEFELTVPYDLSTFNVLAVNTVPVVTTTPNPESMVVHPNGSLLYVISETNGTVDMYRLHNRDSLSQVSFVDSLDLMDIMANTPQGLFIREHDGKLLYVVDTTNDEIFTLNMSLNENNSIITKLGTELITKAGNNLVAVA